MTGLTILAAALTAGGGIGEVRLHGPVGDRMDAVIANHVAKTDPCYLSHPFHSHTETMYFHTEFWGKYMQAAPYFWKYSGDSKLRDSIERGVRDMISTQTPDGYIGHYNDAKRLGVMTWDVWGCKYTLLGLLCWYDVSGDKAALDAAVRLGDYLAKWFDPKAGHAPLHETGWVAGLASCSLLEPIVGLYVRTRETRFLEFAKYILAECDVDDPTPDKRGSMGPALIRQGLAGIPVAERSAWKHGGRSNRRKAYEMMSCYQGILDFGEATGNVDCFTAAKNTVEDIITNEVNLAGSGAAREFWYHGACKQHLPYTCNQETCVTTTWMRLLERMFVLTGDPRYADQIERAFYNAFLGALRRDGAYFATYSPLGGYRCGGQNHCFMFTNCCNANGPRGFLVLLEAMLRAEGDSVYLSFYNSAEASVTLPANGRRVDLDVYTLYPKDGSVTVWNRTKGTNDFALRLRIPAWSSNTVVKINGKAIDAVPQAGTFFELRRRWTEGDSVELSLDMTVRAHLADHAIAFTSGPVLLARDSRFNDGDISEVVRYNVIDANYATPWLAGTDRATKPHRLVFDPERVSVPGIWMSWTGRLPIGCHGENEDGKRWSVVRFCDYASAGGEWAPENYFRTWLPVEYMAWE